MIIQTVHHLKVGEIVRGGPVADRDGVYRPLTFQVLREATEEEYRAQCEALESAITYPPGPNFYLVSPD